MAQAAPVGRSSVRGRARLLDWASALAAAALALLAGEVSDHLEVVTDPRWRIRIDGRDAGELFVSDAAVLAGGRVTLQ